ncbi:MAG: keto-deoxy-phosphogluconate aldolase, partial [Porticoccaceae bacterium]|nr:keto-deoxy-phosphogluconate aldolase [Porticoccaceae bacterium]
MNKLLTAHPIVPVVVIERIEDAVPLAEALVAGGLPVLEVTLRTDAAIPGIKQIIKHVPEAIVGSGTVNNANQFSVSEEIGCQFIVSPGSTDELLDAARASSTPFLPGVSSASEVMRGLDYGFDCFKFFPAEAVGG